MCKATFPVSRQRDLPSWSMVVGSQCLCVGILMHKVFTAYHPFKISKAYLKFWLMGKKKKAITVYKSERQTLTANYKIFQRREVLLNLFSQARCVHVH